MEELIEQFNKVLEQYNAEYTEAKDDKQRDIINIKYEKIITEAEKTLEKSLEDFIKQENEKLLLEQKQSEQEILDLSKEDRDDSDNDNGNGNSGNNGNGNGNGNTILNEEIKKIEDIKEKYSVKELKQILKNAKIKGYSRLNQDALVRLILDNNLL